MTLFVNRLDGKGLEAKIFVGDTDTALILRLFDLSSNAYDPAVDPVPPPLDVSAATPGADLTMRFAKPGDNPGDPPIIVDVPATFATATVPALPGYVGDGSDGYIEYRTTSGFLDRAGRWRREGLITLTPGAWASEIIDFEVFETL